MEAKDTVMKKRWMNKHVQKDQDRLLLEQAEISFKAGQESVTPEKLYSIPTVVDVGNDAFKDGRVAGIKEVADFVKGELYLASDGDYEIWESKLKDWGIK